MTTCGRRHPIVLGTVVASLGVLVPAAEADDHPSVRVRIENHADLPTGVLAGAKSDAARIYRAAGIEVVWLNRDEPAGDTGVIRVVIPSLEHADEYLRLEHVDPQALASANAATRLVHIFWERLRTSASQVGRDEAGALGQVLAHEIGHVLLPGAGHSPTGIMQASIKLRMLGALRFTAQEGEQMRNRLLRRAPDVAVGGAEAIRLH